MSDALRFPKPIKRVKPAKRIIRKTRPRQMSNKQSAKDRRDKDSVWSQIVRKNAGNRCEWNCNREATEAHHVRNKHRHPEYRWVIDNGCALCRQHHNDAHRNRRAEFFEWFKQRRPYSWEVIYEA